MDHVAENGDAAELENGSAPLLGGPRGARAKPRGGVVFDKHGRLRSLTDPRARTTVVVNLASVLERCNEQTLPALYKYVGADLRATPKQLGYVTLAGALTQALCAPIGGVLGHRLDRVAVVSVGALVWGLASLAFAAVRTVPQAMAVWAWNGLGIALLLPNAQSLIADYFSPLSRGKAFGALALTGALGAAGSQLAAGRASVARLGPVEGWRAVFVAVGLVSLAIGALNAAASVDPRTAWRRELRERRRRRAEGGTGGGGAEGELGAGGDGARGERAGRAGAASPASPAPSSEPRPSVTSFPLSRSPSPGSPSRPSSPAELPALRSPLPSSRPARAPHAPPSELREIVRVLTVPSFLVIILQGIVGSTPWNALTFSTLYFQLLGMSDGRATSVSACFLLGGALGSILGGWVGDRAAKLFPNHGRIFAAQFSVLVGIPIGILIFKGMPVEPGGRWWPSGGNATALGGVAGAGGAAPELASARWTWGATGGSWGVGRGDGTAALGGLGSGWGEGAAALGGSGWGEGAAALGGSGWGDGAAALDGSGALAGGFVANSEAAPIENSLANSTVVLDALDVRSVLRPTGWISSVVLPPSSHRSAASDRALSAPLFAPLPGPPPPPPPSQDDLAPEYAVASFVWGLLITWAAPACNSPMFAEIVPAQLRSLVYAFDRAFENAIAACGAPFVGYLAERYGFRGLAAGVGYAAPAAGASVPGFSSAIAGPSSAASAPHLEQARALGTAIVLCTAVPWTLCVAFYSALHLTYRKDRERATADELELEEEELEE